MQEYWETALLQSRKEWRRRTHGNKREDCRCIVEIDREYFGTYYYVTSPKYYNEIDTKALDVRKSWSVDSAIDRRRMMGGYRG